MKLLTYEDLGDLALFLLSARRAPRWCAVESLRRRIGDLSCLLRSGRRNRVLASLASAFAAAPAQTPLPRLGREAFRGVWADREIYWLRKMSATPDAWLEARRLVTLEGVENLRRPLDRGAGVIMWEPPLGNRVLGRLALAAAGFRLTVVHGPAHGGNPSRLGQGLIRGLHGAAEGRMPFEVVRIDETSFAYIELLVDRLRGNQVICAPSFGALGRRFASLDFLGMKQRFATGVVSLAMSTGAALVPSFCFRDASGHHLRLEPALPIDRGSSAPEAQLAALARYAGRLESYVLRYPEQWKRWHDPLFAADEPAPAAPAGGRAA